MNPLRDSLNKQPAKVSTADAVAVQININEGRRDSLNSKVPTTRSSETLKKDQYKPSAWAPLSHRGE